MVRSNVFILLLLFVGLAGAQDRYMVFFSDKEGTTYSLTEPLEFLSQRAIDRREKNGVSITEMDFPVNAGYVQQLDAVEGVEVYFTSRWMNAALVEMPATSENAVEELSFVDRWEFIAPGTKLTHTPSGYTVVETFTEPTGTATTATQLSMLEADDMHTAGHTGEGVLVAVFDGGFTGVNQRKPFEHIFTNDRLKGVKDFVGNTGNPFQYNDHGTRVLSCIAGRHNTQFSGTAPDVEVLIAVTEDVFSEYRIEEYNWLLAAEWADSAGVDVINTSLGYFWFDNSTMDYTYEDMDGQSAIITQASNWAADRGILLVTSAGNEGGGDWFYIAAPADAPNVLAIAAVNSLGSKAGFSSFGPTPDNRTKPDVAAMGQGTTLINSEGTITSGNGTSYSSPLIAGFVAALIQAYPEKTAAEIREMIRMAGHQAHNPDNELGWGIPTYSRILNPPLATEGQLTVRAYPNPFRSELNLFAPRDGQFVLLNIEGKQVSAGSFIRGNQKLQIPAAPPGLYFLQVQSGGSVETIKLLKK